MGLGLGVGKECGFLFIFLTSLGKRNEKKVPMIPYRPLFFYRVYSFIFGSLCLDPSFFRADLFINRTSISLVKPSALS